MLLGYNGAMPCVPLIRHPSTPCAAVHRFDVRVRRTQQHILALAYSIAGEVTRLHLPEPLPSRRVDGLWRHTCFEVFLGRPGFPDYHEFNLSPSTEWALYRFGTYREGMSPVTTRQPPDIAPNREAGRFELHARIDLDELGLHREAEGPSLALAAVIETVDGTLSYWALAHPSVQPDFHHPEGFVPGLARSSLG